MKHIIRISGVILLTFLIYSCKKDPTPPVISTTVVTAISYTTATSGGEVTNEGGASVTARGICWNTSADPTVANIKTTDGTGTGSFSSSLTGLIAGTTYYVRAYATNTTGTGYGNPVTFTTLQVAAPVLTTTAITSITQTTAVSGGNITTDNGSSVTARGVCWGIDVNPTTNNNKTSDATGTGIFTSTLTGLIGNTTYYVRAYATNSAGTEYGNQVSFKTSPLMPTISTTTISSITQTTATSGGNVTSDGGATVTARGVCWSTSADPTIALSTKTADGTGTGIFTSSITVLTPNTTYYVRAYATNSAGTAYGSEISFTTSPITSSADLLENATDYTGSYPTPSKITYSDRGVSTNVTAYPGQIIVFFNMPISETDASQIIVANGGTIIAKIPAIGYYFVSDSPTKVSEFISAMQANSKVDFVSPHIAGSLSSEVAILDGCSQSHGANVKATLQNNGGTFDECRDIVNTGTNIGTNKVIKEILTEGNQNKAGTTLINLSSSGFNGPDWDLGTTDKVQAQNDWLHFMRYILLTIAALPSEYRENLVITIAAGNGNMPITNLMTQLRSNPRIASILENNVLVVSTTLMRGNYSTTDPDVAIRDNLEAQYGTSFAAPGAMAIIQNIMRLTGADAKVALKAVKQAVAANANHKLLQSEAIDKANAILGTLLTDTYTGPFNGTGTLTVDCSQWKDVYSLTIKIAVSGSGTLIDPYKGSMEINGSVVGSIVYCTCNLGCGVGGTVPINFIGTVTGSQGKVEASASIDYGVRTMNALFTGGTFSGNTLTGVFILNSFEDAPIVKTITLTK